MSYSHFLEYLQLEKKYSQNTIIAYENDLKTFQHYINQEFDVQPLKELHYNQIRKWIISLVQSGISNRSINRKVSSLKSYYKFLYKIGEIETSPLEKHKALKVKKEIQIPFSEEEIETVLDNFETDTFEGLRDKIIVMLFYATGIRRIELINIRLSNIDLDQKLLRVLGKRNKERIIPLLDEVVKLLKVYLVQRNEFAQKSVENLFITSKGIKLYESLVYRIINNYFSKASGKTKKSPHILRHSFATHLLSQGANLNAVKELLGHSSLAATQVYTHNNIMELAQVHKNSHPRQLKKKPK